MNYQKRHFLFKNGGVGVGGGGCVYGGGGGGGKIESVLFIETS